MTVADERFGVDLYVPLDEEEALRVTPTGDLPRISGYSNLGHALVSAAITAPGTLLHRPDYGGGLADDVESAGTPGTLARASTRVRLSLLQDERLAGGTLDVDVSPGLPDDPGRLGTVTATITAVPHGDTAPLVVTVTES